MVVHIYMCAALLYLPNFKWHFHIGLKNFNTVCNQKAHMVKALLAKEQKIEVPIPHDIKLYYKAVSSTDSMSVAYTKPHRPMKQINK